MERKKKIEIQNKMLSVLEKENVSVCDALEIISEFERFASTAIERNMRACTENIPFVIPDENSKLYRIG